MGRDVLILGGDMRNRRLCDVLKRQGHKVEYFSDAYRESVQAIQSHIEDTRCIVLPMAAKAQKICGMAREQILESCRPGSVLFCGTADAWWAEAAREKGSALVELLDDETYAMENAYYTAEGAICLVQEKTQESLWKKKCVVVGGGRIAQALFGMLRVHTTQIALVARRQSARARFAVWQAQCYPFEAQGNAFEDAQIVFNTVPEPVIDPRALMRMRDNGMYVELASAPYGCAWEKIPDSVQKERGGGIPGKRFAVSAAQSMAKAMAPYLK